MATEKTKEEYAREFRIQAHEALDKFLDSSKNTWHQDPAFMGSHHATIELRKNNERSVLSITILVAQIHPGIQVIKCGPEFRPETPIDGPLPILNKLENKL